MADRNRFLLLLQVQTREDGTLVPLTYAVGSEIDFDQATTVDGRYTICLTSLTASTLESAAEEARGAFAWFQPILKNARPSPWLAEQLGISAPVERVVPDAFIADLDALQRTAAVAQTVPMDDLTFVEDDPELEADVDNVLARAEVLLKHRLEQQGFVTTGKERNVPRQVHSKEGRRALVRALLEIL